MIKPSAFIFHLKWRKGINTQTPRFLHGMISDGIKIMKFIFLIFFVFLCRISFAQHQHDQMPTNKAANKKDTVPSKNKLPVEPIKKDSLQLEHMHEMGGMKNMDKKQQSMNLMSHSYSKNLPMGRNGSGTSWVPDASAMYMYMSMTDKSMWMFHGNIFLRYTKQDLFNEGSRGDDHFDAPNWFMGMYNKQMGEKGLFNATAMISLDPLLVGEAGYPLLFQTGESYQGKKLVDRQHPHDLFSGLTIGYTQMLSKNADLSAYFGYPGEPALGPPAFMHRISTMNNPDAPLGHHWQDATHITFGVGTLGFRYKNFKIEGSVFTGREPDENRYDFDKMKFDSYSYRLSANPSENWALQFSQGFIHSPELLEPETDITRTTASVLHSKWLRKNNCFSQSFIWGLNHSSEDHNEHSFLYEANLQLTKQAVYGRYEFVQKSPEELDIPSTDVKNFDINVLTAGYNRMIMDFKIVQLLAGTQFTLNFSPEGLRAVYGKTPLGGQLYLQLRPRLHRH
jgi:hypothetical protein